MLSLKRWCFIIYLLLTGNNGRDRVLIMQTRINNTCLELIQGDITKQNVDAIVNAANSRLAGGGGVDGAIHRAGGPKIMEECRKIGGCPTGTAVITTAGRLPAKYVVHTVGPVFRDGKSGEPELLQRAYKSSLKVAEQAGARTIAFPSISTGVYGYPVSSASMTALSAVIEYIKQNTAIEKVVFVLYSQHDFDTYCNSLNRLIKGV